MEFKGTKGKWYHENGSKAIFHPEQIGVRLLTVDETFTSLSYTTQSNNEWMYNAKLSSKAPELLDALHEIVCAFENNALTDVSFAKQLIKESTTI